MNNAHRFLTLGAVSLLAACTDVSVLGPAHYEINDPVFSSTGSKAHKVTVMNWNIYIGADVDAVIAALASPDPSDDLPTLLTAIQTLQETDVLARMQAVAREIARARPHVVGLQEVSELDIDLTGLGLPVDIHVDFLPILLAALAVEGVNYTVAAIVTNIDATPLPGVRVVDHDVLLVDADRVTVNSTVEQNFTNNIGVVAPGVALIRGWVSITATIDGESFTFANTHLESGQGAALSALRAAQATELVTALGAASPAILMGDLNDLPGSLMHQVISGAGFTDVWGSFHPGAQGLTCCHLPDLSNQIQDFDQRIDYVFARGVGHPIKGVMGQLKRLGEVPADRLSGPAHRIWPSDHAGLVTDLLAPPANGLVATAGQ